VVVWEVPTLPFRPRFSREQTAARDTVRDPMLAVPPPALSLEEAAMSGRTPPDRRERAVRGQRRGGGAAHVDRPRSPRPLPCRVVGDEDARRTVFARQDEQHGERGRIRGQTVALVGGELAPQPPRLCCAAIDFEVEGEPAGR